MKNSEMKARSIAAMRQARQMMEEQSGIATKSGVQRITGLCLNTVRRNWKYLDQTPALDDKEEKRDEVSWDTSKEPLTKPSWWRDREYYLDFHGDLGEEMYLGQFEMLGRKLF